MGQLGFHVQPDGIVTLVESAGQAWQAGLRQNSRLVEICKVAVATLTYDQMVDLLKTSLTVTLTVIPPLADGSPRKGCTLQNCKYNETNYEGDYDSVGADDSKSKRTPQMQQAVSGHHRRIYERSFSPPRSSNSSGYGTGSSSKSFHGREHRYISNNIEDIITNSSGQTTEEKWGDLFQELDVPALPPTKSYSHARNTFPYSPKKTSNEHHLPPPVAHPHYAAVQHHNKIQFSNSLPLQHVNFQPPMSAAMHGNASEMDLSYGKEKGNVAAYHNSTNEKQRSDKLRQENDYMQITRLPQFTTEYLSDSSISDRINLVGSEDDLSTGSGSHSPRPKPMKQMNPSNNCRNHSPRSLNGEAKLRPGVTSRSSNRNSANLTSNNNLQEELLRLINPDNIESTSEPKQSREARTNSRENVNSVNSSLTIHKPQPEVILTMARPATVISNASTTSSPLAHEFRINNASAINKVGLGFSSENFPLPEDSDWPSLVDTATRVMNQVCSEVETNGSYWDDTVLPDASYNGASSGNLESQKQVSELNRRIASLERENRRLKDENRRFQEQAQTAVQQLRKFTEWFFKNVKKQ